jgi:U11/U12 small nuclear ribonucleoprotein SNRNP20
MAQQSNIQGSQPNFVGYQAADGSSFSGDLIMAHSAKNNIVTASWSSAEN